MTDSGCGFVMSKAGILKLLVLISGCACWALLAASKQYRNHGIKIYAFAAYIISWAVSLLLYFFKATGLHLHIQSDCFTFNTFDYFWSWLSCINYLVCSVIVAIFFGTGDPLCGGSGRFCLYAMQLTSCVLGFVTAILYAIEAQNMKSYAPVGAGYGTTWRGIWKAIILIVGGLAFGLLLRTGIKCGSDCTIARTFVLVAWCVAWGVAALMYLLRIITCTTRLSADRQVGFGTFEFFWSAFACLLFLVGAAVLAGFLKCNSFRRSPCRDRLVADICGWVTAVLFAIDAFCLREHRPVWFVSRRVQSSGGGRRTVTTTTTTERRARS